MIEGMYILTFLLYTQASRYILVKIQVMVQD